MFKIRLGTDVSHSFMSTLKCTTYNFTSSLRKMLPIQNNNLRFFHVNNCQSLFLLEKDLCHTKSDTVHISRHSSSILEINRMKTTINRSKGSHSSCLKKRDPTTGTNHRQQNSPWKVMSLQWTHWCAFKHILKSEKLREWPLNPNLK